MNKQIRRPQRMLVGLLVVLLLASMLPATVFALTINGEGTGGRVGYEWEKLRM